MCVFFLNDYVGEPVLKIGKINNDVSKVQLTDFMKKTFGLREEIKVWESGEIFGNK